jgi:hypothetical protein
MFFFVFFGGGLLFSSKKNTFAFLSHFSECAPGLLIHVIFSRQDEKHSRLFFLFLKKIIHSAIKQPAQGSSSRRGY